MTNVNIYQQNGMPVSPREWLVCMILCFFVGFWGVHRFYVGKVGTGILMFFTFGGLGIWWFIDLIIIATASFRDKEGRPIPYSSSPIVNTNQATQTVTSNESTTKTSDKNFNINIASELRELASLKDDGIITEDEFNKKKKELLG